MGLTVSYHYLYRMKLTSSLIKNRLFFFHFQGPRYQEYFTKIIQSPLEFLRDVMVILFVKFLTILIY